MSDRIEQFRQLVFAGIKRALEIEDYCKAYEGTVSVVYPSYFAGEGEGILYSPQHCYVVRLDCYVLGPSRRYDWTGETLDKALDAAEKDVRQWIAELEEE